MKNLVANLAALRLRLIDDWRKAYKFATIQFATFFVFLFGLGPSLVNSWSFIPDDLKNALPQGTARWLALAAFLLTLLGRVTKLDRKQPQGDVQ